MKFPVRRAYYSIVVKWCAQHIRSAGHPRLDTLSELLPSERKKEYIISLGFTLLVSFQISRPEKASFLRGRVKLKSLCEDPLVGLTEQRTFAFGGQLKAFANSGTLCKVPSTRN